MCFAPLWLNGCAGVQYVAVDTTSAVLKAVPVVVHSAQGTGFKIRIRDVNRCRCCRRHIHIVDIDIAPRYACHVINNFNVQLLSDIVCRIPIDTGVSFSVAACRFEQLLAVRSF